MTPTLEDAIRLAALSHAGQVDKADEPYILHPLRVMSKFADPTLRIIAVLHDVIEDTAVTIEQLRHEGYPKEILQAMDAITRQRGEDYEDYITRVSENNLARQVKLADLKDNLTPERIAAISEEYRGIWLQQNLLEYLRACVVLES